MTAQATEFQIHRFHESVAFHTEGPNATETVYLSAYLAREFGVELIRFARDVDAVTFHESGLGTVEVPDKGVPVYSVEQSLQVDLGIAQAQRAELLEALTQVEARCNNRSEVGQIARKAIFKVTP